MQSHKMKSDTAIFEMLQSALSNSTEFTNVSTSVRHGEVRLEGEVKDKDQKKRLLIAVSGIGGVTSVADKVLVQNTAAPATRVRKKDPVQAEEMSSRKSPRTAIIMADDNVRVRYREKRLHDKKTRTAGAVL